MQFFVIISALMAVAVTAAPTPDPDCNAYTCQHAPPPGAEPDVGPGDLVKSLIP
ncbi:hypothetical protein CGRA01v4_14476 [Colletotrichum graminicola]|uniref:Uncharacterized protein n=1 Tax=Colletotrichum graminicola (strain M1.001 / M2 / FGSC 10212) TaxID=645133 RepID=E3Q4N1_COLGM|nr:uncharacterized protein GLRG_01190 [Colletotrichum graminicola M1.001]EFQ26046.1 hypothetical protein GLRG_01190 [Colletotrichum graminicola M1.001]WDK23183.1 hypothetical protein CGRA01v4_14476 [Colletotrichum graminicola]